MFSVVRGRRATVQIGTSLHNVESLEDIYWC